MAHYLANQRADSVLYTLTEHASVLNEDENIKKYIMQQYREAKSRDNEANQKKRKFTQDTQDRLYKAPETSLRKEKQKESETNDSNIRQIKESNEFVHKLTECYKAQHGTSDKGYTSPAQLLDFWNRMPNRVRRLVEHVLRMVLRARKGLKHPNRLRMGILIRTWTSSFSELIN